METKQIVLPKKKLFLEKISENGVTMKDINTNVGSKRKAQIS